jgi:histidinol phosphatase-like enzyme (inositol monophosphatase family)
MSPVSGPLLEAALEAARRAGAVALAGFGRGIAVDIKGDGSPVTEADRGAERAARDWIAARFPDDGILGEEFGLTHERSPRRWLVDPIDGTRSFVRGVPLWGSLVALAEGDRVLAGAAVFPALGEEIAAAPGGGAWWNGARCAVSGVSELARATVLATDAGTGAADARANGERQTRQAAWQRLAQQAAQSRTWGDCYGYLLVATGRAELMADPVLAPWDAAALVPIVEEAGGVFTDWHGHRGFQGGSAIATNAALAAEARRELGCRAATATREDR